MDQKKPVFITIKVKDKTHEVYEKRKGVDKHMEQTLRKVKRKV